MWRARAFLLPALAALSGCNGQATAPQPSYVGAAVCMECHREQYDLWEGSHHDLAMQEANAQTVLGNFAATKFTYTGVTSTFFKREGKFFVNTDGPDGKLADFEIKYTLGVAPLQQYLIEFPDGRVQALSIAWDTRPREQGGQRWFHLYPGERITHRDPLHWTGLSQNWNFMCADCHSTNLRRHYDAAKDRFATAWSEINVACEACHGPGSAHVAWANKGESWFARRGKDDGLGVHFADKAGWAIDPSTGNARRSAPRSSQAELDTCASCHARRAQIAEGHRPGKPALDSYLVSLLTPGLYEADGQMRDEVYTYGSFLQSKMHAAGVSCGDCHEPHSLRLRAEGNGVCARCHAAAKYDAPAHHRHQEGSKAVRCVSCHMPVRTYMVVDPRHDHSFRVPRPDVSAELGTPNACNDCHRDKPARWAANTVEKWHGPTRKGFQAFAPALAAMRAESLDAPRLLRELAADKVQPAIARATAAAELAPYLTPSIAAELQRGLADPDPLVRLGALRGLAGLAPEHRWSFAGALLNDPVRAVRLETVSFLAAVPSSQLKAEERAVLDRAIEEYIFAQMVNADRPEAHLNLGSLHAQRAEAAKAEGEYRAAIKLDRGFVPAYVNLADLYRAQGRDIDGERVLRAALAAAPNDASARHALGLLLVRVKRLPEATTELARAARLDPASARYAYVHAIAIDSAGKRDAALRALEANHRRHPADRGTLAALVSLNREVGASENALRYARRLYRLTPDDPGVSQLIAELEAGR